MASDGEWMTLARVLRPQGRRGEVLAELFTDFPEQFTRPGGVSLLAPDGARIDAVVTEQWLPVGRNAGRVVLKIAGMEDISAAEKMTGVEVQIPASQRLGLEDEIYYVNDLVGCTFVDGGNEIGVVEDVHFPCDSAGRRLEDAAAIFVVRRADGDDLMVPFANEFVARIDTAAKRIEMNLPHGLLEING